MKQPRYTDHFHQHQPAPMRRITRLVGVLLHYLAGRQRTRRTITTALTWSLTSLVYLPLFVVAGLLHAIGLKRLGLAMRPLFARTWLFAAGIEADGYVHKSLDPSETYVYMFEHQNLIDAPLMPATWPHDTRALGAKQYANLPMFGWAMRVGGTAFIDRNNLERAKQDLATLAQRMRDEGFSVMVAPTGKRSPGLNYPPFKKGVFHMALDVQRPVVPVYTVGLERLVDDTLHCRPGQVAVVYGQPIRPEEHPEAFIDADALRTFVRQVMDHDKRVLRGLPPARVRDGHFAKAA